MKRFFNLYMELYSILKKINNLINTNNIFVQRIEVEQAPTWHKNPQIFTRQVENCTTSLERTLYSLQKDIIGCKIYCMNKHERN